MVGDEGLPGDDDPLAVVVAVLPDIACPADGDAVDPDEPACPGGAGGAGGAADRAAGREHLALQDDGLAGDPDEGLQGAGDGLVPAAGRGTWASE